jgi:thiamine biosynthesis lipoprotein
MAERWERTFSRFRFDSELSRLNARPGMTIRASPLLLRGVQLALEAHELTGGLFSPAVLRPLEQLGYDRTFKLVPPALEARPATRRRVVVPEMQVEICADRSTVISEAPLDLGGVAKGLYVDSLVAQLAAQFSAGIVSAGGDLRVWGCPAPDRRWAIAIEDPREPARDLGRLRIASGAVATSGSNRRRWWRGGEALHHLIDPRTGRPAAAGLQTVTVLARSAAWADVVATAVFVAGCDHPIIRRLRQAVIGIVAFTTDDEVQVLQPCRRGRYRELEAIKRRFIGTA